MDVLLLDTSPDICAEWQNAFRDVPGVAVHHGRFEAEVGSFDCLVSPANSFGLMDGGIDAAITAFFGLALQDRVQREIWRCFRGEQPIGTCLMVPTGHEQCPWLAHCPTMRLPANVAWTNNAYAAFVAALTGAEAAGVNRLACPGLGTLTGRMPADVCARQMRFAYDTWREPFRPSDWKSPGEREWKSYGRTRAEFLRHSVDRDA